MVNSHEVVVDLNDPELTYTPDRELSRAAPSLYTDTARHQMLRNKPVTPEQIHSAVTTYLEREHSTINDFTANILANELLKRPPRPRPLSQTTQDLTIQRVESSPQRSLLLHRLKGPLELIGIKL